MAEEKRKLVVTISTDANGDRSTVGLTVANAALSAGMEVLVFLASDGVGLAREGAADLAHIRPFKPLSELIDAFVEAGGAVVACGSCLQYRGISPDRMEPKIEVSGVATLVSWLAAGATAVSL
jgi:predicted peroxiredoxin